MRIHAGRILTPSGWAYDKTVCLEDGRITGITDGSSGEKETATLLPGFFDSHIHGGCGFDACSGRRDHIEDFLLTMAADGVTDALLTLSTAAPEALRGGLSLIAGIMAEQAEGRLPGTRIRGAHLEGPFVNPGRSGAMVKEWMRAPDAELFDTLTEGFKGLVKMITVAPELEGAESFAAAMAERGVFLQAGHTDATYDRGDWAFTHGFRSLCHTFNAARPIHHREPGIITAALLREEVYCEAISDLQHLHPGTLQLIYRCKGPEKMLLVSDSTMPNGLPDGRYFATNHPVIVTNGVGRTESGNLSGGTCFLGTAAHRLASLGIPEEEAFAMASRIPAERLGLAGLGRLEPGCPDHLTALDEQGDPEFIIADGSLCRSRTGE